MADPALNRALIPNDTPRVRPSCSQLYQLTLRPKPGSDAIRNLRAALKALGRRYHLQVTELRPVADKPRQPRVKVEERKARTRATSPHYSFFGQDIPRPPTGWPEAGE